jgi:penicillin-binding protein 1C
MTMLYSAIPNGGMAQLLRIRKDDPQSASLRLFGETAAWYLTDTLAGSPLPDGWAMGRGIERRRRVAFKTGTSYGHRDAWSIGFSQRYTVGVWVGRADGSTRPGRFGRNEAAPLLLKIFDVLPPEIQRIAPPPTDVIVVNRTDELPRAMQRFRPREILATPGMKNLPGPPTIMFPPDGAIVGLPQESQDPPIVLRAEGGTGPLRWIVDGEILPETPRYEQTFLSPKGEGFSRITVVDADGRAATSTVRFKKNP